MTEDFGMRLKRLRESRGWSQKELGARVNKSSSIIWRYEANIQQPTLDILLSFSALFNVSLNYLACVSAAFALTPEQQAAVAALEDAYEKYDRLSRPEAAVLILELQKQIFCAFPDKK